MRPTVNGYIAVWLDANRGNAEQLSKTILENALAGDSVAGLAVVLAVAFADEEEYPVRDAADEVEDDDGDEEA